MPNSRHTHAMKMLRALPKAELHLHLEGAIRPSTVVELAARHGVSLTEAEALAHYEYTDFMGFLDAFKWVTSYLQEPADFALITRRLTDELLAQNVVYAEVIVAVGIMVFRHQDVERNLAAINEEARLAEKRGLRMQWMFDATRQFGPDAAMEVARWAARMKADRVVAFGMGGDEMSIPAADFQHVYDFVAAEGLHRHVHAGEMGGPGSMWDAVNLLKAERIGHGIAAMFDERLMEFLKASMIPLEVCPTSNVCTGALEKQIGMPPARIDEHPLKLLYDRTHLVTLATDDPAMFHTNLLREYEVGLRLGLSLKDLVEMVSLGFAFAFLPARDKELYLRAFSSKAAELGI